MAQTVCTLKWPNAMARGDQVESWWKFGEFQVGSVWEEEGIWLLTRSSGLWGGWNIPARCQAMIWGA